MEREEAKKIAKQAYKEIIEAIEKVEIAFGVILVDNPEYITVNEFDFSCWDLE